MHNDCKEFIINNLNKIKFKDEILEPHPQYQVKYFHEFIIDEKIENNANIDISKVVGTNHPDYQNHSWEYCLKNLKRNNNLNLLRCNDKRPSILYYTDKEYRKNSSTDPWSIDVINGEAYITQGNHRSIISKFLAELNLIDNIQFGLNYVKYKTFDNKAHKRYMRLENFINNLPTYVSNKIQIKISKQKIKDRDTKYKIQYSLVVGYCYNYNKKIVPQELYQSFDNFNEFKKSVFEQIRFFKKQKNISDYILITIEFIIKYTNKICAIFVPKNA